jgi:hypothetical protein
MLRQLRVVVNVSKGSPLTGPAWIDVLFGGIKVVDRIEITAQHKQIDEVTPNPIEFTVDYDDTFQQTLTVINHPDTIGPVQIYHVEFHIDGENVPLTWQQAIKGKPLRFGGQPNQTITNPHVNDPKFSGWVSVSDVSPGMSITWGLIDLVVSNKSV